MQTGEIYYGQSDQSTFQYYKLALAVGNRVELALTMTQANSSVGVSLAPSFQPFDDIVSDIYNLFVGVGYMPDLTVYDYVARTIFAPPHQLVSITINNPVTVDIYIGVYGTVKFDYELSSHSSCALALYLS